VVALLSDEAAVDDEADVGEGDGGLGDVGGEDDASSRGVFEGAVLGFGGEGAVEGEDLPVAEAVLFAEGLLTVVDLPASR
jgi:hypothetical protein